MGIHIAVVVSDMSRRCMSVTTVLDKNMNAGLLHYRKQFLEKLPIAL